MKEPGPNRAVRFSFVRSIFLGTIVGDSKAAEIHKKKKKKKEKTLRFSG